MVLEAVAAAVAGEVHAGVVVERGAGGVAVGGLHAHDGGRIGRPGPRAGIVGMGAVFGGGVLGAGDVVMDVLDALAVPAAVTGGEALLHAAVLEADRGDVLALLEAEVCHGELGGLGRGHVGAPELPPGEVDGSAVLTKGGGGGLVGQPGVLMAVGEGCVGTRLVDVVIGRLVGPVPDVHLAVVVLEGLRRGDRCELSTAVDGGGQVVLDRELVGPGVRRRAEVDGVGIGAVVGCLGLGGVQAVAVGIGVLGGGVGDLLSLVDLAADGDGRVVHRDGLDLAGLPHLELDALGLVVGGRRALFGERVLAGCERIDLVILGGRGP